MITITTATLAIATDTQRRVLRFIRDHIDETGCPPTIREVGMRFFIQSPNGVMCHLNALEKKGYITMRHTKARSIRLVGCRHVLAYTDDEAGRRLHEMLAD